MAKPSKVLRYKNRIRKPVPPGQKVPLTLSNRERELILEHTFADDELTAPLRTATIANKASVHSFTGYVATAAARCVLGCSIRSLRQQLHSRATRALSLPTAPGETVSPGNRTPVVIPSAAR